ncbi:desiccation-related protein PCC27-45-like [Salvia hispanica]|uniref:desiccation-related protein PCC27-45-like n=1 Tax=Salvia hispanica TaxID=49212 RepID=UPI0020095B4B|nr:desiccation-related protein PCC27-45-like [Salvia hispanica]
MQYVDKAKDFVADKVADIEKPSASVDDVDLKHVGRDGITYLAKVTVVNPYGVSVPVGEITYTLKSVDRVIASGNIPDPGSLKGNDKTILEVGMKVPHSVLVSLIKDIGADWDVDYTVEIGIIVDLPVFGNFTIPLTHKGEMKLPSLQDCI